MKMFEFYANDPKGIRVYGCIQSSTISAAAKRLQRRGYTEVTVHYRGTYILSWAAHPVQEETLEA